MRTATPLVTCSFIIVRELSTTELSISMPRLTGPGMHHDNVFPAAAEPLLCQGELPVVFPEGREERALLSLLLNPQQIYNVQFGQDIVEVVGDVDAV